MSYELLFHYETSFTLIVMNRLSWLPFLLVGLAFILLVAPETRTPPAEERGFASAYGEGVMADVIRLRFREGWWRNPPPRDWYTAHGAVAAMDCSRVGNMATLVAPDGRAYRVLIADCAGDDGAPDRFSRNNIIVELDWGLWKRLTAEYGRPLRVELRH
jgi:hypothetical protein